MMMLAITENMVFAVGAAVKVIVFRKHICHEFVILI